MVNKKKYHGGLKVLLLLLFIMLLGTHSICYAVDYTDFEIPIEFFDSLLNYINSTYTLYLRGGTTSVTSGDFKTVYDNRVKSGLKQLFLDNNADERNLLVVIKNELGRDSTSTALKNLDIYFVFSNNTVNNISDTTNFLVNSGYITCYPYQNLSPQIYKITIDYLNGFDVQKQSAFSSNDTRFNNSNLILDTNTSTFQNGPWFGCTLPTLTSVRYRDPNTSTYSYYHLANYYDINPAPVNPSGDSSGDSSGDTSGDSSGENGNYTGQLNDINNNITTQGQAIVNAISGESTKIVNTLTDVPDLSGETVTSGDIIGSLGFQIESNPYENFWVTLTQNLKNALLGSVRSIDITFKGRTWTISLDEYFVLPPWLTIILIPISTSLFTWVLVRQWKIIFDKISSGNVDSLLKENSEEGISNLF